MSKKGPKWEREVAVMLSNWWTEGERDDVFWRTAGSGARATTRAKKGKRTANSSSDLCALDDVGRPLVKLCLIEDKRGYNKDFSVIDMIDKKKGAPPLLKKWLDKANTECIYSGRIFPIIILKRDRRVPVVILNDELIDELNSDSCLDNFLCSGSYIKLCLEYNDVYILKLHDFMYYVSPDTIRDICDYRDIT